MLDGLNALESKSNKVLQEVLAWSKNQQYRGYNKHDGLNSPLLKLFMGWAKWPRIIAIQTVMRFPLNLRPLLLAPKTYNPKGLALFIQALLTRYESTGNSDDLHEANQLLNNLDRLRSPGTFSGACWGYHYPWQDLGFFAPKNTPNAVVTCFVCEAFLTAYRITKKKEYLQIVESASQFLLNDLTILKDQPDELCLGYMPMPMTMRVMDVSILIGSVLSGLIHHGSIETRNNSTTKRLVTYVVNQQTTDGAWFYTDPPSDSHITHDNYHTGFILDALWRYMHRTGDHSFQDSYDKGLAFYAEKLFNQDGSPRWMHDTDFPHDIHGAAQGILTFSRHSSHAPLVEKILNWSLENMYSRTGRFSYQQGRYFTKRFTLLRWCNGWMSYALAEYAKNLRKHHQ